jgi:hypothetical protein
MERTRVPELLKEASRRGTQEGPGSDERAADKSATLKSEDAIRLGVRDADVTRRGCNFLSLHRRLQH